MKVFVKIVSLFAAILLIKAGLSKQEAVSALMVAMSIKLHSAVHKVPTRADDMPQQVPGQSSEMSVDVSKMH